MNREDRMVFKGCCISGVVFGLITFCFYPDLIWTIVAIIAGFSAGYLGHSFKDALHKIPIAYQYALDMSDDLVRSTNDCFKQLLLAFREWTSEEHPFLFLGIPFAAICVFPWFYWIVPHAFNGTTADIGAGGKIMSIFLGIVMFSVANIGFSAILLVGAKKEKCFFVVPGDNPKSKIYIELRKKGFVETPVTYRNACRWFIKQVVYFLKCFLVFLVWDWYAKLVKVIWSVLCFCRHFIPKLIILIDSHERVFCGICGVCGGFCTTFPRKTRKPTST